MKMKIDELKVGEKIRYQAKDIDREMILMATFPMPATKCVLEYWTAYCPETDEFITLEAYDIASHGERI